MFWLLKQCIGGQHSRCLKVALPPARMGSLKTACVPTRDWNYRRRRYCGQCRLMKARCLGLAPSLRKGATSWSGTIGDCGSVVPEGPSHGNVVLLLEMREASVASKSRSLSSTWIWWRSDTVLWIQQFFWLGQRHPEQSGEEVSDSFWEINLVIPQPQAAVRKSLK